MNQAWLVREGLTTAAYADLREFGAAVAVLMLLITAALWIAVRSQSAREYSPPLAILVIAAWANLAGLAVPLYLSSIGTGSRTGADAAASLLGLLAAFATTALRSKLALRCCWSAALRIAWAAVLALFFVQYFVLMAFV